MFSAADSNLLPLVVNARSKYMLQTFLKISFFIVFRLLRTKVFASNKVLVQRICRMLGMVAKGNGGVKHIGCAMTKYCYPHFFTHNQCQFG